VTFDPVLLLTMWAAGLSAAAAVVAFWKVARVGYLWLAGGVTLMIGFVAAFQGPIGVTALVLTAAGIAIARPNRQATGTLYAMAAIGFLVIAADLDGLLPAISGSLALGGITAEMLLGHWYLVDPQLPRWALRRLDAAGGVGVVAEIVVAAVRGTLRSPTDLFGAAHLILALTTILLAFGVWYSLKEEGYEGVMAATGLSYLATLTVLAVVFLGRTPVEELLGLG
jgi:hypothetical protein